MRKFGLAAIIALASTSALAGSVFEIPFNEGVARIYLNDKCRDRLCASVSWKERGGERRVFALPGISSRTVSKLLDQHAPGWSSSIRSGKNNVDNAEGKNDGSARNGDDAEDNDTRAPDRASSAGRPLKRRPAAAVDERKSVSSAADNERKLAPSAAVPQRQTPDRAATVEEYKPAPTAAVPQRQTPDRAATVKEYKPAPTVASSAAQRRSASAASASASASAAAAPAAPPKDELAGGPDESHAGTLYASPPAREPRVAAVASAPRSQSLRQSPVGEWRVEDGAGRVRIEACGANLCGYVSAAKNPAEKDRKNPDPALRNRSVIGMPVLINMKQAGNRWNGSIYNMRDGKTYAANIALKGAETLRVEGCALGGLICGGQTWSRAN